MKNLVIGKERERYERKLDKVYEGKLSLTEAFKSVNDFKLITIPYGKYCREFFRKFYHSNKIYFFESDDTTRIESYNELTIDKKNFIKEEKFLEYTGLDFLEFSKSSSELLELLNSIMHVTQYNSEEYELKNQIIRTIPPQDLYTGNSLVCTKSEDCLGCYDEDNDFTTIYYRTSVKGMYEVWTSNSCSYTSCYEGFQGFI